MAISEIEENQPLTGVSAPPLSQRVILLLAVACGVTVANLYYNQPLLAQIAHGFHTTALKAGLISMCTQIGYAIGMLLFVPLGDIRERRNLVLGLSLAVAVCLMGVGAARSLLWMDVASLAVGITTVVPQILVPLAASLAKPEERGHVIGTVMSGLLIGILLARTLSGFIGQWFGWRAMFWIAAGMMVALAGVLRVMLPYSPPENRLRYGELLRSLWGLIQSQRILREAALIAAMQFGGFSVFWTCLAFLLEGPPFHMGSQVAGLFGLVGVVGAMIAPIAGRLADRFPANMMIGVAILLTGLSFGFFWVLGHHLWGVVVGVILLDMGVQGAQILNQSRIYSLVPEARGRLNTVYMVTSFVGGSIGSTLGSSAWTAGGWNRVCFTGLVTVAVGFVIWCIGRLRDV